MAVSLTAFSEMRLIVAATGAGNARPSVSSISRHGAVARMYKN